MPLFQPFVYEGENFVQSDTVYNTDVAVFLNRTEKKMYLWAGKRAKKETVEDAQRAWTKFIEKYADFKSINLIMKKDLADFELAKDIRALLGQHAGEENAEKAKNKYNKAAKICSMIGMGFLGIVLLEATITLLFPVQGEILLISETNFTRLFDSASIMLYVVEGLFAAAFILALLGKNSHLYTPSLLAMLVNAGLWLYLAQRDYLFYFQDYGVIPEILQIMSSDIIIFIGILAVVLIGIVVIYLIGAGSLQRAKRSTKALSPADQVAIQESPLKNAA